GRGRVRMGTLDDIFANMAASDAAENGRAAGGAATRRSPRYETETELTLEEVATGTKRLMELDGRRIEVTVPAGVEDGQRIRFSGVGGDASDVYLRVSVKPHPLFTRQGSNLERELPLTLGEALLGTEVPVETLSGRVLLRIPPETQNGRSFRLTGKGLPRFRGEGRGDLFVRTRVVLPTKLDEHARQLARQFTDHVHQPDPRRHQEGSKAT
ncbi:MAG: HSP40/DnaJ peptide-binding protein, partial [Chloroflexota bacterium]|nr:HSP40/DnaJ peptide-binding protein [Chloroflexota bacterium]